jgi:hypothetical protein
MATHNNLHIPDELFSAVNEAAHADGKTNDELAADAPTSISPLIPEKASR